MKPDSQFSSPRVVWLLSIAPSYWQPLLAEFTRRFPQTTLLTAGWPGFLEGFEQSIQVQVVGTRKFLNLKPGGKGYGQGIMILPLGIVGKLMKLSPQVIFTDGFCLWTLLVLLLKPWKRWKVLIIYAGSSPGVDARQSPWRLYLRRCLSHVADGVITNHTAGGNYLIQALKIPVNKVFVRPFLISVPQTATRQHSRSEHSRSEHSPSEQVTSQQTTLPQVNAHNQALMFLYIGQIIPRKGVQELLCSCLHLQQQGYSNYQLFMIGDGEQLQPLQNFCQQHGLTQVQWFGHVAYSDLGFYLQQADVFIFPSLEDVWGMVVPEAMSFGKPILCSQWAGAAELVVPGKNGYQFDPYHPQELAALMRQIICHPESVQQLGEQSQRIIQKHTPATAAAFLAEVTTWALKR